MLTERRASVDVRRARRSTRRGAVRDTPIAGEHPLTLYVDKHETPDADDARRRARGAGDRLPAQPAAARPHRGHRLGAGRLGRRRRRREDARTACSDLEAKTAQAHDDERLRPGHGVRRPDGGDRRGRGCRPARRSTQATLYALLDRVRLHETIYKQAGAVHGCALATERAPTVARDPVCSSRTSGATTRSTRSPARCGSTAIDGGDKIFYTTGRLTSEMVIKAAQMGIPFLVSRSGLTQMGYEIAQKVGITMIGRATGKHLPAVHRRGSIQAPTPRRRDDGLARRRHRHRAGRRPGPPDGRRRQGMGRARGHADGRARAASGSRRRSPTS